MSSAREIVRDSRRRDIDAAPGQTVFSFDRPLFATDDLGIYVSVFPATAFTEVTSGFTIALAAGLASATVTFALAPRPTSGDPQVTVRLQGERIQERLTDVTRGGTVNSAAIEDELDRESIVLQELRRDVNDLAAALLVLGGTLPAANPGAIAWAAFATPYVRRQDYRANDFVHLHNHIPTAGATLSAALPGAMAALAAKGGGKLRLQGFMQPGPEPVDLGNGSLTLLTNKIMLVGEGETIIQSTKSAGPIVQLGDGVALLNSSGMEGVRVFANNTVSRGTDPIVWLRNGWKTKLDIAIHANGTASGGACLLLDGGGTGPTANYDTFVPRLECYGDFVNGLIVGKNARVINLIMDYYSIGFAKGSAIIIYDLDGAQIGKGEVIGAGLRSLELTPGPGQHINDLQMDRPQFDSATEINVLIKDQGGHVENIDFTAAWIASAGQTLSAAAYHENVRIEGSLAPGAWGSSGAPIQKITFNGGTIGNGGAGGWTTINCDGVDYVATKVNGNGVSTTGFGGFVGAGSRNVRVTAGEMNGRFNADAPPTPVQAYAIAVVADTDGITVSGNADWGGNVFGPVSSYASTGTHNAGFVAGSLGYHA